MERRSLLLSLLGIHQTPRLPRLLDRQISTAYKISEGTIIAAIGSIVGPGPQFLAHPSNHSQIYRHSHAGAIPGPSPG